MIKFLPVIQVLFYATIAIATIHTTRDSHSYIKSALILLAHFISTFEQKIKMENHDGELVLRSILSCHLLYA